MPTPEEIAAALDPRLKMLDFGKSVANYAAPKAMSLLKGEAASPPANLDLMQPGKAPTSADLRLPEALAEGGNILSNFVGGPGGAAKGAAASAPFWKAIFLGPKAKIADPIVKDVAGIMEKRGASPTDIWEKTFDMGQPWFRGSEGKWRFEVPDAQNMTWGSGTGMFGGPHSPVVHHPLKEAAYPGMQDMRVSLTIDPRMGTRGAYNADKNYITAQTHSYDEAGPIVAHEFQHGIQRKEGFQPGGNPMDMLQHLYAARPELQFGPKYLQNKAESVSKELYKRLAGENEAYNVMNRFHMSAPERRANPPWKTQDVPKELEVIYPTMGSDLDWLKHYPHLNTLLYGPLSSKTVTPQQAATVLFRNK